MKTGEMTMNLTKTKQKTNIHPKIQHFFEQELMPLTAKIKQQQEIIPWVHLDADAITYYKTRPNTTMSKEDFEIGGHSTLESFAADLTSFWDDNKDYNFCELVPQLVELASELRVDEDQNEEISPYIYVMF